jgi:hypothetical protein
MNKPSVGPQPALDRILADVELLEPKEIAWAREELAGGAPYARVRWHLNRMRRLRGWKSREELKFQAILARSPIRDGAGRAVDLLTQFDPHTLDEARTKRGPRSSQPEMVTAIYALRAEGRRFSSKKAEWRAVLKRLSVPEGARGWSYVVFSRIKI